MRQVRYTPERWPVATTAAPEATSSYAAGYKTGYEAGLAAARRQVDGEGAATAATERNGAKPANGTWQADAPRSFRTPALDETTETETQATPPLDEVASMHLGVAVTSASLRGSLASLERQNNRLEADSLERILDEADLESRIEHKLLVPLPASAALMVNPDLEENHRYCRVWTARFVADLARAHAAVFHKPIEVNSAVRTVEYQKRLMNSNGNAAAAEGDIVSPHLTGATVDIAKQGLSRKELAWMRSQLLGLQEAGKIDVEEEFQQACFHITVYKSYATPLPRRRAGQPVESRGAGTRRKAAQPAGDAPAELPVGELPAQGR